MRAQRRAAVCRSRGRGYTVIELMLSLSVLAIGAAGIVTMQRVTVESNRHAKALVTATHIAQSWLDQLTAESGQWKTNTDLSDTILLPWLSKLGPTDPNTPWFRPDYKAARHWGPAFDFLGRPLATPTGAVFCSDLRLQWLYPAADLTADPARPGSGLIRVEVRVFWLNDNSVALANPTGTDGACSWQPTNMDDPESARAFHFVYMSTAVLQHDQI